MIRMAWRAARPRKPSAAPKIPSWGGASAGSGSLAPPHVDAELRAALIEAKFVETNRQGQGGD
jgi:hypothetical protein